MALWDVFHRCKSWPWLAPLLLAAVLGMAGGWYYYWQVGQFQPGHPDFEAVYWWPLVADSPNAVLLWFVAVLAYRLAGWRNAWLDAAAFITNIYVGLWTTALFVSFPDVMGTYEWHRVADGHANPVLFVTHMGMPLLALVLVKDMLRDAWTWPRRALVVAAAAIYILVDYWGPHIHPAPFLHRSAQDDALLHAFSPWLMVFAVAAWLAVTWTRRPAPPA